MRKKGLVERIVMREPASEDFSQSKLPENRRKLFSYMLKNKFSKIYINHLLTSLFFLPLIIWGVLTLSLSDWIFSLDPREGITHFVEYWFTVYVTAIPMWALAFFGLSGGLNVIRKLAWSDPVIIKTDFLAGIKSSGRQMALVGLLWGVAYAIMRYAFDWLGFYYQVFDSSYSVIFGSFICIFLTVILFGLTVYMACMSCQYNVTFLQLAVGAFKLYFSDFFLANGVILASLAPLFVLTLLGYAVTTLIAYLLLVFILIGIMIIPMFLVCQHSFDRVINIKDYPDYYGRGLSYGRYVTEADDSSERKFTENGEAVSDAASNSQVENDFERVSDDENRS
ncbi:MAG: hypothetical protein IJX58_03445 [Clostridia bacterium]|nr:hypothetical protein [Clostridia bacterium]